MTLPLPLRRIAGIATVVVGALALAGCLLTPGKFTSEIDIRNDGRFSFSYSGEIVMLGLTKLAQMGANDGADAKFEPSRCTKGDSSEDRPCTKDELAKQKADWDEVQKSAGEKRKSEAEKMRALFGGIDPTDPKAAQEFAARLSKQAGWKKVTYKGDGVYDVEFAISGRLDHDFVFPTIERFPLANQFVVLTRRSDGTIRIEAPAFAASSNSGPYANFAQMAATERKTDAPAPLTQIDGHFTLTTNGTILANNTDEGPKAASGGQTLEWTITPRTSAAPTALVRLGN